VRRPAWLSERPRHTTPPSGEPEPGRKPSNGLGSRQVSQVSRIDALGEEKLSGRKETAFSRGNAKSPPDQELHRGISTPVGRRDSSNDVPSCTSRANRAGFIAQCPEADAQELNLREPGAPRGERRGKLRAGDQPGHRRCCKGGAARPAPPETSAERQRVREHDPHRAGDQPGHPQPATRTTRPASAWCGRNAGRSRGCASRERRPGPSPSRGGGGARRRGWSS